MRIDISPKERMVANQKNVIAAERLRSEWRWEGIPVALGRNMPSIAAREICGSCKWIIFLAVKLISREMGG